MVLITNYHVIDGCNFNKVHINDKQLDTNTFADDKVNDIAIKINNNSNDFFTISSQDVSLLGE